MNYKNIAVVIPSFNESSNLKILILGIFKSLPGAKIFIVDDSKKEEGEKIKKIVKSLDRNKTIHLYSRQKKLGRGTAVQEGIKEALKSKQINIFFEMDSDLSHDPLEFEIFLKKTKKQNYDLIVGSRYLENSKIKDWPLLRIILSRIINKFLSILLGLNTTDYTNGFRLYNRQAAVFFSNLKLQSSGFIVLSEVAFKLKKNDYKITEVPITFKDRMHGKSSMGVTELFASLISILKIRLSN